MQPDEDAVPIPIRRDLTAQENDERANETSVYSCPECGGVLWQIEAQEVVQFHCHVGHTYSPEGLMVQKSEALEAALWACVRMLREKATLTRQMARRMREAGRGDTAAQIEEQAELDEQHIQVIREQLLEATPNPIAQALQIDESMNTTG